MDWSKAAAAADYGADDSKTPPGDLKSLHREALQLKIRDELAKIVETSARVDFVKVGSEPRNIVLSVHHHVSIIRSVSKVLALLEGPNTISDVVDQDSALYLKARADACAASEDDFRALFQSKLIIRVRWLKDPKDEKETVADVKLAKGDCERKVDIDLHQYLDKDLTLSIVYKHGGKELPLFDTGRFAVKNLGFITDFPVVSEVTAAIGEWPIQDDESQSSVPVGWGYDLSEDSVRHLAITFPWILGFNPRSAPDLSRYLAAFPHISVILSNEDSESTVTAAMGLGLRVAGVFTFAWGVTLEDSGRHFLLTSVSIPDVVRALQ